MTRPHTIRHPTFYYGKIPLLDKGIVNRYAITTDPSRRFYVPAMDEYFPSLVESREVYAEYLNISPSDYEALFNGRGPYTIRHSTAYLRPTGKIEAVAHLFNGVLMKTALFIRECFK